MNKKPAVYLLIVACYLACCVPPYDLFSEKKIVWDPITNEDWNVTEDSVRGIYDAAMLFDKIVADDQELLDSRCYLSIYRRIRVLNSEGRIWGNVVVPLIHPDEKIEEIYGRTILPDGREIPLSKSHIYKKEIIKTKGFKIKRISFSLPGVSDDCIIEYLIKYRLPTHNNFWMIQKDIYLMRGEYLWKHYRGSGIPSSVFQRIADEVITPNYTWLNTDQEFKVEKRPSVKEPEEVVFSIENVPAYESEPYSVPDVVVKSQLRFYYGGTETPAAFWGNLNKLLQKRINKFTKENIKARSLIKNFAEIESRQEIIDSIYIMLQAKIYNVDYDKTDKKYQKNENVDDVIKRKYGTGSDINKTFYDMLREMNIDAKMIYVYDRDDNIIITGVKSWQFDRSMVAIPNKSGDYDIYSPAMKYLSSGDVPWVNEGTLGFLIGDMNRQFISIGSSIPRRNRISRNLFLTLDKNFNFNGYFIEMHSGLSAYSLRLRLANESKNEQFIYVRDKFLDLIPNSEVDSFSIEGLDNIQEPIKIKCKVNIVSAGQELENRLIFKPSNILGLYEIPFQSTERKYPIVFKYGNEIIETLNLDLPLNWEVEALPPDSSFSNQIGKCEIVFKHSKNTLSVNRMFRLNSPIWDAVNYADVLKLFQTRRAFEEMLVVIKNME